MLEHTRPCPKCSGTMHYRLGEYQCAECDHSEQATAPKEEHPAGGVHRREAWQPSSTASLGHSSYTGKLIEPPADPGSQPGTGGAMFGGGYQAPPPPPPGAAYGQASWEGAAYGTARGGGATSALQQEKLIFMLVLGVMGILSILASFASESLQGSFAQMAAQQGAANPAGMPAYPAESAAGSGIASLLQVALSFVLAWMALYGQTIWLKWTCIGCQSIGLIAIVIFGIVALAMVGTISAATAQVPGGGMLLTFVGALVVLQLALQVWFISLIYRDIRERQVAY